MYRMWLLFDPRRTLVALFLFRFNWLEGPHKGAVAAQMAPMPAK